MPTRLADPARDCHRELGWDVGPLRAILVTGQGCEGMDSNEEYVGFPFPNQGKGPSGCLLPRHDGTALEPIAALN